MSVWLKNYKEKKKEKQQKIQNLSQHSREELQDIIIKQGKEVTELQEKLTIKTSEVQRVKDDCEGYIGTITQLQEALNDSIRQIQEKSSLVEQKDNEMNKLNYKIQSLTNELEKQKETSNDFLSQNKKYQIEMDELKMQIQVLQAKKLVLNDQNGVTQEQEKDVEERVRQIIQLQNENLQIKNANKQLNEDILTYKKQNEELQSSKARVQEQIVKFEREVKTLMNQIEAKQQEMDNYKKENSQVEQLKENLKKQTEEISFKINEQGAQIQNSTGQLQQANKLNQEMQQKIQKLEHEIEIKTTKHNNEIYRQKEHYEVIIRDIKENHANSLKFDRQDKEKLAQLTEELEIMRKKNQESCQKNDELTSMITEQQTIIDGFKIKQLSLENENQKLQKLLEQNELKRQLAKKEVLKLTERLEKRGLQTIQEEDEKELRAKKVIDNIKNPVEQQNQQIQQKEHQINQNNIAQKQESEQQQYFPAQSELIVLRKFKKEFEALYKELLKLVMTAPTSIQGQSSKVQTKRNEKSPEVIQQKEESKIVVDKSLQKKTPRRVASVGLIKGQNYASNNSNIQFMIPADDFSKFERKYNNTLMSISDFLENPTHLLQTDIESIQQQNKWTQAYSNFKKNVKSTNPLKMLHCMKPPEIGENDIIVTRSAIPKGNSQIRGRITSYTGDQGGSMNELRRIEEEKKSEVDNTKKISKYQHL